MPPFDRTRGGQGQRALGLPSMGTQVGRSSTRRRTVGWASLGPATSLGRSVAVHGILGRSGPRRKGACPRLHPPTCPHERTFTERLCGTCTRRPETVRFTLPPREAEPRPVGQAPALVGSELQAVERVVGEQQVPVEVDPFGERRDHRRAAIPTDVSSMQPRNVRKPSSRARSSMCLAGPIPPHLASFTLTPATTPTRASRSSSATHSRRPRSGAWSAPGARPGPGRPGPGRAAR